MKNRRKTYVIEKNFQTRFILRFILVIVGATLLSTGALLGVFYFKFQFGGADLNNLIIMITPEGTTDVSSLFGIVLIPILAANMLILCVIVPYSLVYSHKVAGPVYRFQKSLDMLLEGQLDFMIRLRKKDEFKSIAEKMNSLIDYMRRNIEEVRSSHRMIRDRVKKIEAIISEGDVDINAVKKEVEELDRFFMERPKPFSF
jgi:hypothetical protein